MKLKPLVFALMLFVACTSNPEKHYTTIDYLTVGRKLDSINAVMRTQLDSTGHYDIPYTDLVHGNKRLIFLGTTHVRDVHHPQFTLLEQVFEEVKPQIAFNEGGAIAREKVFANRDTAILQNGETGLLKLLCDQAGIRMINGDLSERDEFRELLKTIPHDQVYLYMAVERFLDLYRNGIYAGMTLDDAFQKEFIAYLEKNDFPLSPDQKQYAYLESVYKKYLGKDLQLDSLVWIGDYYLHDQGVFGKIGRATKEVRDEALLKKIDEALDMYDRVFVVFGGSHRIALEPALQQIIERPRQFGSFYQKGCVFLQCAK